MWSVLIADDNINKQHFKKGLLLGVSVGIELLHETSNLVVSFE
jgi:hypothetical protein